MFKRKKKRTTTPNRISLIHAASSHLQAMQRKWADWMQVKTRNWKPKHQKRFLFIICIVIGSFSTLNLLQLFKSHFEAPASREITTPQPLPRLIHQPLEPTMVVVTDTMVFCRFRQYIDSLVQTPEGKKKYEQFLKERPGFMDSLAVAEQMSRQSFPQHKK